MKLLQTPFSRKRSSPQPLCWSHILPSFVPPDVYLSATSTAHRWRIPFSPDIVMAGSGRVGFFDGTKWALLSRTH